MANALQELVLRIGGDSSGGQQATRDLANALANTLNKALQDTGQKAEESGHKVSGFQRYLEELKPSTDNAHASFTSLHSTLTEMWENPTAGVKNLAGAVGTDLSGALATAGGALGTTALVAGGVASVFAVAGVAAFELAEKAAKTGANLQDLSEKTGMTVESVSRLAHAAPVAGTTIEALSNVVFMMQKQMAESPDKFEKGLERLHIEASAFKALKPEDQLIQLSAALKATENPVERIGAGVETMGKQFKDVAPALYKLNEAMEMTKDLNPWSKEEAEDAERFDMQLANISVHFHEIATTLGRLSLPAVAGVLGMLQNWAKDQQMQATLASALLLGTKLAPDRKASDVDLPKDVSTKIVGATYEETSKLIDGYLADQKKAAEEYAQSIKNLTIAEHGYEGVIDALGPKVVEGIRYELEHKGKVEDIARAYAGAGGEIKTYAAYVDVVKEKIKAEGDEEKAEAELQKQSRKALGELLKAESVDLNANAKEWDKLGLAVHGQQATFAEYGKLYAQQEDLIARETMTTADYQVRRIEEWRDKSIEALDKNTEGWERNAAKIREIAQQETNDIRYAQESISAMLARIAAEADHAPPKISHLAQEVDGLSQAFARLGQMADGGFGRMLSGIGQGLSLFSQYQSVVDKYGAGSPEANRAKAQAIQQSIGIGAGLVSQTINDGPGASTGSLVSKYALSGASAGSVGGYWGMGIGAGVGAAYGWYESGKEWRKAYSDVSRDFGNLHIPEDFAKTIEEIESTTGLQRTQALTTQLAKLIEIAGGLKPDNFNLFFSKLHDAFSYLETGTMTVSQVTQVLDSTFADFARVGTDVYGRINDQVRELIDLNQRFGTQSQAIADWMKGQASAAATGLNDLLTQPMIARAREIGQSVSDAKDAVKKAKEALDADDKKRQDDAAARAGGLTSDLSKAQDALTKAQSQSNTAAHEKAIIAAQKAVDKAKEAKDANATGGHADLALTKALTDAQSDLSAALDLQHQEAVRNKENLDDLGAIALTTFNAALASGDSFLQALAKIGPALSTIQQAYSDLGLVIEDATLKGLTLENAILNGTADKPSHLGQAIGGLQAGITASMNLGPAVQTPEAFAAQQRQLASLYTQAQAASAAQGVTGAAGSAAALLPFQQVLHEMEEWAKKNGQELSADTQEKIRQSKDLNLWNDDYKDDAQKTRESMADVIKSNDALASAIGGLPQALADVIAGRRPSGASSGGSGASTQNGNPADTPTSGYWNPGGNSTPLPWPPPEVAFATEAYVRRPTMAMVGDVAGGEFVLKPATVARWMGAAYGQGAAETGSGGSTTYNVSIVARNDDAAEKWRDWMRKDGLEIAIEEIEDGRFVSRLKRKIAPDFVT